MRCGAVQVQMYVLVLAHEGGGNAVDLKNPKLLSRCTGVPLTPVRVRCTQLKSLLPVDAATGHEL